MYDTRTNSKGYVKGVKHKLDKAWVNLKQATAQYDGTEIALEALDRAEMWVQVSFVRGRKNYFDTSLPLTKGKVAEGRKGFG